MAAKNPTLLYNFNENSTTTIRDYSQSGYDGTGANLTVSASTRVGYDAVFNGTTSNITTTPALTVIESTKLGYFFAINLTSNTGTDTIFFHDNIMQITWDGTTLTATLTTTTSTYSVTNDITALSTGTWYDITINKTGADLLGMIIDGVLQTTTATLGTIDKTVQHFNLGSANGVDFSAFKLNEFKIYDAALSLENDAAFRNEQNGVLMNTALTHDFNIGDIIAADIVSGSIKTAIVTYVEASTVFRIQPISDNLTGGMIFNRVGHLWDTDRQWRFVINDTPEICFYDGIALTTDIFLDSKKTYCIGKDGVDTTTSNLKIIDKLSDLPTAVAGVITLETPYNYFFTKEIDLLGDRLDCNGVVSLLGGTPELSKVTSTGLAAGTALLTSEYTVALNSIAINHTTALALDATANANQVLDWFGVNFEDSTTAVGTIKNYDNTIFNTIGFLNSGGLTFDGTIGTIAFTDTIFENTTALTSIILPTTLTVSRRFRIDNSSFVSLSGETALNVSTSATIPNEGYILNNVNFSGGGTYLTGVQSTDNKARFEGCRNIDNSGNIGQYFMVGNATATTISVSGTFYKVAGTTSTGTYVEKFDVTTTSNKAVYGGSLVGFYKVTVVASMLTGNNKVLAVRIAKNGTTTTSSQTKSTSNGSSRSESIMSQDVVQLSNTDYIEVFVANTTDTTNITVEDLNVIIERLN